MRQENRIATKHGFTLVELLVVVGVVGILIAILAPALLRGKRHAQAAVGTANMRSLGQALLMYADSHRDGFLNPFGSSPHGIGYAVSPHDRGLEWNFTVADAPEWTTELFAYYWYSYLAELDGAPRLRDEQFSPADAWMHSLRKQKSKSDEARTGTALWPSSFLYSPTFWFDSARYGAGSRWRQPAGYLGTQFTQSVGFPSQKVLLFERMDFEQQTRIEPAAGGSTNRVGRPPAWHNPRSVTDVFTVDGSIRPISIEGIYAAPEGFIIPSDRVPDWDRPGLTLRDQGPQLDDPYVSSPVVPPFNRLLFWATPFGVEGRDFLE